MFTVAKDQVSVDGKGCNLSESSRRARPLRSSSISDKVLDEWLSLDDDRRRFL